MNHDHARRLMERLDLSDGDSVRRVLVELARWADRAWLVDATREHFRDIAQDVSPRELAQAFADRLRAYLDSDDDERESPFLAMVDALDDDALEVLDTHCSQEESERRHRRWSEAREARQERERLAAIARRESIADGEVTDERMRRHLQHLARHRGATHFAPAVDDVRVGDLVSVCLLRRHALNDDRMEWRFYRVIEILHRIYPRTLVLQALDADREPGDTGEPSTIIPVAHPIPEPFTINRDHRAQETT